ncbi:MAG: ABC transporter permease [Vicinamibacteria bacterium]|nr:ABC transporter permease [Vicinamibacteria bacterium]
MIPTLQDLRLAMARLRARPGRGLSASVILALGIGASTAIFTLVDATLFQPFDFPQAERLVRMDAVNSPAERTDPRNHSNSSYPMYQDYRAETSVFAGLAAFADSIAVHVSGGGGLAFRVTGAVVTGNYFDVLGARAAFGRTLTPADDRERGAHPVVVLSEGLSRTLFGGPDPTGRTLRINGQAFEVVGAMASGFNGVSLDSRPLLWMPMAMHSTAAPEWSTPKPGRAYVDPLDDRRFAWLDMVGRLAPGVSIEQAQSRLDAVAAHRAESLPGGKDEAFPALVSAREAAIDFGGPNETRKLSWLLFGVVGLLLALACADAASLQLAQGDSRRAEIATRAALGASRGQLIRQLLAESTLTSLSAAVLGLMVAVGVRHALIALMPSGFAIPMDTIVPVFSVRPVLFAGAVACLVTLLFGLAPALRGSRADLVSTLRAAASSSAPRSRLRDSLVVAQVALSAVLLVGAGLLLHSLARAASTKPGFAVENAFVARVDLARQGYTEERGAAFYEALLREARAIPGVRSAALSRHVPVQRSGMRVSIGVPGYVPAPKEMLNVDYTMVSPRFFETLGAPLVRGRDFDSRDVKAGAPVAIINDALARKYFAGRDPVGLTLTDLGPFDQTFRIVGVAPDMKLRTLREEPRPAVYVALAQAYMPSLALLVRTEGAPGAAIAGLQAAVARLDKDLPLFGVTTLDAQLGAALDQERSMAVLLSAFSLLALILAAFGLGALLFHQAQSRTREFGVRMALGARPRAVLRLVLVRGARLSAAGALLGLTASLFLAPMVESFLFDVRPQDPTAFLGSALALAMVSAAAGAIPALRASRIDPAAVLRSE